MKFVLTISIAAIVFIATGEAVQCISCVEGPVEMTSPIPLSNCNDLLGYQSSSLCWDSIFCTKSVSEYEGEIAIIRHCVSQKNLKNMEGINEEMFGTVKLVEHSVEHSVNGKKFVSYLCISNFCNNSSPLFMSTVLTLLTLLAS